MKSSRNHMLSLVIGDRAIHIAEAVREGRGVRVVRESTLSLDSVPGFDAPEALGARLAAHLTAQGHAARRAIIGLSARQGAARCRRAPASASPQARVELLRLALEREAAGAGDDGRSDFLDGPEHDEQRLMLVVSARRVVVEQTLAMARAAGLQVASVTATPLELATLAGAPDAATLHLTGQSLEATVSHAGKPLSLTRVALDGDATDPASWAGAVRRAMASEARRSMNGLLGDPPVMLFTDDACPPEAVDRLRATLGKTPILPPSPITPAAAVVTSGLLSTPAIDLLHSRLAARPSHRLPPWGKAAVTGGAVLLLIVIAVAWAILAQNASLRSVQRQHELIAEEARRLGSIRERSRLVEPWFDRRADPLARLAAITEAFPERGRIWATGLRLDGSLAGVVQCRSESRELVLELVQRMQASQRFTAVQLREWTQTDTRTGLVGFEVEFTFVPIPPGEAVAAGDAS